MHLMLYRNVKYDLRKFSFYNRVGGEYMEQFA